MIKYFCDNCDVEAEALETLVEEGYENLDVCDRCDKEITSQLDKLARKQESEKRKLLGKYFRTTNESVEEHEHTYPDQPGWVAVSKGVRTGHYTCTHPGCGEELVK